MTIHEETEVLQEPLLGKVNSLMNQSVSRTFTLLGWVWRVWKKLGPPVKRGPCVSWMTRLTWKVRPNEAESFKRWLSKRLRIYRKLYGRRHSKNVDGSAGVEGRLQQGLAVPEDIDTEILISTMVMVIFSRHTCSLLLLTLIVLLSRFLWAFWTGGVSLEEEFNSPFPLDHPVDIFIQWGAKSDVAALPLWSNLK